MLRWSFHNSSAGQPLLTGTQHPMIFSHFGWEIKQSSTLAHCVCTKHQTPLRRNVPVALTLTQWVGDKQANCSKEWWQRCCGRGRSVGVTAAPKQIQNYCNYFQLLGEMPDVHQWIWSLQWFPWSRMRWGWWWCINDTQTFEQKGPCSPMTRFPFQLHWQLTRRHHRQTHTLTLCVRESAD